MDKQINFYLGKETDSGFIGYLTEDNFFLIIEIEQNYSKDEGDELILNIKKKFSSQPISNLYQLEELIQQIIVENNLPTDFSLATVFFKDNIAYLKTVNCGKIFLRRKNQVIELISGNQSASGYVNFSDIFILTTKKFVDKLKEIDQIEKFFNHKSSNEILDIVTPILKENDDSGLISLFIQINKQIQEENFIDYKQSFFNQFKQIFKKRIESNNFHSKKIITYFIFVIIFLIFIWSVVLGYQRRKEKEINLKIEKTERQILNRLSQAEEIAFLNLNQAKKLIEEANNDLANLKKEIKISNNKINKIEKMILEKESQIIKKQTKNYQEFYDLHLDREDAYGERFFLDLDNDNLFILDKNNGIIYKLSLEKKALEKIIDQKIKKTRIFASYNNKIYLFVDNEGIYEVAESEKIKKIIDFDKDWGEIKDISTYNGNIYLLDIKKDEIYKYIPTDAGFSTKNSYFSQGQAVDLGDAHSLAIDGSIYIGFSKSILKFKSGERESFKNNFPISNLKIEKIYTSRETAKLYIWDKVNQLIYVLTKDGDYQEQITSHIINRANDFLVYKNKLFFLKANKIYVIE